jgi:hypothetical protein
MAAPAYPVYEGDGAGKTPRRPTAAVDLGGLDLIDSSRLPPQNRVELSATDYMQATMSLERVARMAPILVFDVAVIAGASATILSCVNDSVVAGDLVVSDVSPGKYRITLPGSKLPQLRGSPIAQMSLMQGDACASHVYAYQQTFVDVSIYDGNGVLTANPATIKVKVF